MEAVIDGKADAPTDRRKFLLGLLFCSAAGVARVAAADREDRLSRAHETDRPAAQADRALEFCHGQRACGSTRRPASRLTVQ